jgi:hypothetical protein
VKRFSTRRLAVALALVPVLGGMTAASAQAEINPGVYRISPGHATTKAMDVLNFASADGSPVVQNPISGQPTQRWRIKKTGASPSSGASFYSLSPGHAPNRCIEPTSLAAGARIVLRTCSSSRAAQRWHIFPRNPGLFQITNRAAAMALQVPNASQTNGRQLVQNVGGDVPEKLHKQFKMTFLSN